MKCEVPNCSNQEHQGNFEGNLCSPCYSFYLSVIEDRCVLESKYSSAYRLFRTQALERIRDAELYKINKTYNSSISTLLKGR